MSGESVKVIVRCRPMNEREKQLHSKVSYRKLKLYPHYNFTKIIKKTRIIGYKEKMYYFSLIIIFLSVLKKERSL